MEKSIDKDIENHDPRDPNPWLAMYLDNSIPINNKTKVALMRDNDSKSGTYLQPIIRIMSKITMFFIHVFTENFFSQF